MKNTEVATKKRQKKCRECGEPFTPYNSLQRTCSVECAIEDGQKAVKKEYKKSWAKEKKERLEKLKTHSDYENELQPVINKITALIDKGMNCICCGSQITSTNRANAGHRFAVGGNNSLRFNLHNIHQSGVCCNKWKNGNPDGYDDGLIKIYGKEYFEYVKWELKSSYTIVKLTQMELMAARAVAMKVVKELEGIGGEYSASERIELRNKFNKQIGIYGEYQPNNQD